ncbi:MAG: exopolyphosphatase [Steroidobacteraceae bacterium]
MPRLPHVLAAVDLGSNSFHMVIARRTGGQLVIVDRLREMVRLGGGMDEQGHLDPKVAGRAIACLERFGHRLEDVHADSVRVVGTSALRRAHGKQRFLERARAAIGHPIEVISGREEARLIYSGVTHTLPPDRGRRLVVDIGGGSTELIVGRGSRPLLLESLNLGCVVASERYFAGGRMTPKRFARARLAARQAIAPLRDRFRASGWGTVAGSSGTIRAIHEAIREIDPRATEITGPGLTRLQRQLERAESVGRIALASLADERRPVFPGGVAILAELFEQLGIEAMRVADGAMREGVLYDLMGRASTEDARETTVRSLQRRYQVDIAQAGRVEATALRLLRQVEDRWGIEDPNAAPMLRWAARLHEVGLDVAHSGYHRHGAYLLANADLPGFSREEQRLLSELVRAHRRRLSVAGLAELIPPWNEDALKLIVLLRLAVLLHRNRAPRALPPLQLSIRGRTTLDLRFRLASLRRHPLTQADLEQEAQFLAGIGLRLRVTTRR